MTSIPAAHSNPTLPHRCVASITQKQFRGSGQIHENFAGVRYSSSCRLSHIHRNFKSRRRRPGCPTSWTSPPKLWRIPSVAERDEHELWDCDRRQHRDTKPGSKKWRQGDRQYLASGPYRHGLHGCWWGLTGSIQAGQSATVQIQFAPQSAGAATGSLTIIGNAANSPLTITLSGTGTPPTTGTPTLTVSPSAAAFGNVTVGQNSAKTIQLANSGTAALTISTATLTGTGFSMSGLTAPMTISAGQSMSFSVQFAPAAAGSVNGSISIANDATGSPVAIALTGTGTQAGISASPASASFGNVTIGASNSQPIMLTNAGNVALTISAATVSGTGFSITGAPTTIAVGGNASFNAVFTPTTSGSVTGSLSLTSNAPGSPLVIPFTGTGVAASYLLGTNPASLSFGNITLNSTSSLPVTLTNNGNSNITISGVTVSGSGFSTSGVTSGLTLQPSQTATLNVAFAPTAAGAAAGSITVTSNASNSPATISLTGSSYAVSLAWQASSSSELAGYNVFRGTSSGSYTQLNTSPITGTAYTDSAVVDNQTYFYVVTAVNTSGGAKREFESDLGFGSVNWFRKKLWQFKSLASAGADDRQRIRPVFRNRQPEAFPASLDRQAANTGNPARSRIRNAPACRAVQASLCLRQSL